MRVMEVAGKVLRNERKVEDKSLYLKNGLNYICCGIKRLQVRFFM